MPYARKTRVPRRRFGRKRKAYAKRPYGMPAKRRSFNVPRIRSIGGVPSSTIAKLKYVQFNDMNASDVTGAYQVFRTSSVFDPDYTGAGHQPSNFDQLSTLYKQYKVLSAVAKCYPIANLTPTMELSIVPSILVCCLSEDGVKLSNSYAGLGINALLEQPGIKRTILNQSTSVYNPRYPMKLWFNGKRWYGREFGDNDHRAPVTASPNETAFFEFGLFSPDGSVDPGSIRVRFEITYTVLFFDRNISVAS